MPPPDPILFPPFVEPTDSGSESTSLADGAALLDFGQRWYPFGGGAAESIFVEFGLSSSEFFGRLRTLLTGPSSRGMDPAVVADMLTVCRKRLWLGE
ncbi:DUF3263 domain-containing protein [Rhodococcoides trifolii]|uniref:DUF3263 domain-containing protein n=1 Tax=Rhodococcoides trifolii TaxID=908250 RepID=UPI0016629D20|nr:DUF3263 domain-containing protein [Rhodococcus trifolii]